MRYFFASNRQLNETGENDSLINRFGNQRESELKFGFFDTRVEPNVCLGMFINPTEWFQNEEIKIKRMETLDESSFIQKMRKLVQDSPRKSLLVVVHGFKEAFPSALRKTAFLGHILDINSPILVFDWPGNQGAALRGYRRARNIAIQSGAELAKTLELINREVKPDKLWLIANSMGGQVVADAFSHLYKNPEFADADIELEDVILTAADVGNDDFNEQFKREIAAMTRNLTVYVSSNDRRNRIKSDNKTGLSKRGLNPV